jgi:hypothetical protein
VVPTYERTRKGGSFVHEIRQSTAELSNVAKAAKEKLHVGWSRIDYDVDIMRELCSIYLYFTKRPLSPRDIKVAQNDPKGDFVDFAREAWKLAVDSEGRRFGQAIRKWHAERKGLI